MRVMAARSFLCTQLLAAERGWGSAHVEYKMRVAV